MRTLSIALRSAASSTVLPAALSMAPDGVSTAAPTLPSSVLWMTESTATGARAPAALSRAPVLPATAGAADKC